MHSHPVDAEELFGIFLSIYYQYILHSNKERGIYIFRLLF